MDWNYCSSCGERTIFISGICKDCQDKRKGVIHETILANCSNNNPSRIRNNSPIYLGVNRCNKTIRKEK